MSPKPKTSSYEVWEAATKMRRNPGRPVQIPTRSKRPSNVVTRHKNNEIPALRPPGHFRVWSKNGVVWGMYLPVEQRNQEHA